MPTSICLSADLTFDLTPEVASEVVSDLTPEVVSDRSASWSELYVFT